MHPLLPPRHHMAGANAYRHHQHGGFDKMIPLFAQPMDPTKELSRTTTTSSVAAPAIDLDALTRLQPAAHLFTTFTLLFFLFIHSLTASPTIAIIAPLIVYIACELVLEGKQISPLLPASMTASALSMNIAGGVDVSGDSAALNKRGRKSSVASKNAVMNKHTKLAMKKAALSSLQPPLSSTSQSRSPSPSKVRSSKLAKSKDGEPKSLNPTALTISPPPLTAVDAAATTNTDVQQK